MNETQLERAREIARLLQSSGDPMGFIISKLLEEIDKLKESNHGSVSNP